MKEPTVIYSVNGKVYQTKPIFHTEQYIRRNVVITAITDALFITDYETEGRAESILNEAIEDADNERSEE